MRVWDGHAVACQEGWQMETIKGGGGGGGCLVLLLLLIAMLIPLPYTLAAQHNTNPTQSEGVTVERASRPGVSLYCPTCGSPRTGEGPPASGWPVTAATRLMGQASLNDYHHCYYYYYYYYYCYYIVI